MGFFVADLDSAAATLRARGVTTLGQIITGDRGLRFVLFRDDAGNVLQWLEQKD